MRCLALSPDGRLIAVGGNDARLVLFETETLQPLAMHVWHEPIVSGWNGEVEALAFSPDGRLLATVGSDERLVLGEVESGDALAEGMLSPYEGGSVIVSPDLCWSLDGLRLAVVTSTGRVEIWRADAAVSPF
jgi:WD40 repeat protein